MSQNPAQPTPERSSLAADLLAHAGHYRFGDPSNPLGIHVPGRMLSIFVVGVGMNKDGNVRLRSEFEHSTDETEDGAELLFEAHQGKISPLQDRPASPEDRFRDEIIRQEARKWGVGELHPLGALAVYGNKFGGKPIAGIIFPVFMKRDSVEAAKQIKISQRALPYPRRHSPEFIEIAQALPSVFDDIGRDSMMDTIVRTAIAHAMPRSQTLHSQLWLAEKTPVSAANDREQAQVQEQDQPVAQAA